MVHAGQCAPYAASEAKRNAIRAQLLAEGSIYIGGRLWVSACGRPFKDNLPCPNCGLPVQGNMRCGVCPGDTDPRNFGYSEQ